MNNPNPFVPKGSLLEQQSVRRSRLKIAVGCAVLVSVTGLMVMLIQGCKRDQPTDNPPVPPADTNPPPASAEHFELYPGSDFHESAHGQRQQSGAVYSQLDAADHAAADDESEPRPRADTDDHSGGYHRADGGHGDVVDAGDTLAKIAKANGVSLKALSGQSQRGSQKLKVKQKLILPGKTAESATAAGTGTTAATDMSAAATAGTAYTVKSGDTLTRIAKRNHVSVKALRAANSLTTDHLKVGQKLTIPAKAEAAAPATTTPPATDTTTPGTAAAPTTAPTTAAPPAGR